MANQNETVLNLEKRLVTTIDGWIFSALYIALLAVTGILCYRFLGLSPSLTGILLYISLFLVFITLPGGLFVLKPNEAKVFTFFGTYAGNAEKDGFWWVNPFYSATGISTANSTSHTEIMKVNDKAGNPIEVSVAFVWRIQDAVKATFSVVNWQEYLTVQAGAALRNVISEVHYDSSDQAQTETQTLVAHREKIGDQLATELNTLLLPAGIHVVSANLFHLAYAPEIAQAMLKKQQAQALVKARETLVNGAVSIVDSTMKDLLDKKIVTELSNEQKVRLISNMLIVLVSDDNAKPVVTVSSDQ